MDRRAARLAHRIGLRNFPPRRAARKSRLARSASRRGPGVLPSLSPIRLLTPAFRTPRQRRRGGRKYGSAGLNEGDTIHCSPPHHRRDRRAHGRIAAITIIAMALGSGTAKARPETCVRLWLPMIVAVPVVGLRLYSVALPLLAA